MKSIILFLSITFLYAQTSFSQSSKKEEKEKAKQENYEKIKALVKSKKIEIRALKANPTKGPQVDLTTRENFLIVSNDSARADLPYYGRAYSGGYSSGDAGIIFSNVMENYQEKWNDKKYNVTITFRAKGPDDSFNCTVSIYSPENASISISSNKKQSIRYSGILTSKN